MTKQRLVVVRAGDNSLHPHWLAGDGDHTWYLVVSYFGDDPDIFKVDDGVRIDSKGPKWPALYELFSLYPNLATDYDYIWLPDDDLMASKADINRLFDICVAYGLEVGPSGPDMEQLLRRRLRKQGQKITVRVEHLRWRSGAARAYCSTSTPF